MNQVEIINAFSLVYWSAIQKYREHLNDIKDNSNIHKRFACKTNKSIT
jgi:hypothetical protein